MEIQVLEFLYHMINVKLLKCCLNKIDFIMIIASYGMFVP